MLKYRIKEIREKAGLSKLKFAQSLGVSDAKISYLESGRTPTIKNEFAQKIAQTYNVDVNWILYGEENDEINKAFEERKKELSADQLALIEETIKACKGDTEAFIKAQELLIKCYKNNLKS
jgi:transcriptional regulator with XRE-family HTH domain